MYFCFENVRNNYDLDKMLNLNIFNIKICFDLGLAFAHSTGKPLFDKYKDKIICSHLHNNFGEDSHNLLTNGNIDYKPIVTELVKIENVSNCLESYPPRGANLSKQEFEDFVKISFDCVKEFIQ